MGKDTPCINHLAAVDLQNSGYTNKGKGPHFAIHRLQLTAMGAIWQRWKFDGKQQFVVSNGGFTPPFIGINLPPQSYNIPQLLPDFARMAR